MVKFVGSVFDLFLWERNELFGEDTIVGHLSTEYKINFSKLMAEQISEVVKIK